MLTKKELEKHGWTIVPKGVWFGVDYDKSYKFNVLTTLSDLLNLDEEADGYDFVVCAYKKVIHQEEEE